MKSDEMSRLELDFEQPSDETGPQGVGVAVPAPSPADSKHHPDCARCGAPATQWSGAWLLGPKLLWIGWCSNACKNLWLAGDKDANGAMHEALMRDYGHHAKASVLLHGLLLELFDNALDNGDGGTYFEADAELYQRIETALDEWPAVTLDTTGTLTNRTDGSGE